jgi:nucleoside phosphorylase
MIHIVTALSCEAKPLIHHYRLNGRQAENGFHVYENDAMRLIIAGMGKCAAAAACAYLQGLEPKGKHIWLNLGIAGHATLNVGEPILAHKVIDAATNVTWYPPLLFTPPCQTVPLLSVDQPKASYASGIAYDMEASGFYATAGHFNSYELVQVLKVISDNHTNPMQQVSKKLAQEIISNQLVTLDVLIRQLLELNTLLAGQQRKPAIEPFIQRWHFTVAQQHKLQRLLQRWNVLSNNILDIEQFKDKQNSKEVLVALEKEIAMLPLRFD